MFSYLHSIFLIYRDQKDYRFYWVQDILLTNERPRKALLTQRSIIKTLFVYKLNNIAYPGCV